MGRALHQVRDVEQTPELSFSTAHTRMSALGAATRELGPRDALWVRWSGPYPQSLHATLWNEPSAAARSLREQAQRLAGVVATFKLQTHGAAA
jgi:hypothetical protein